MIWPCFVRAQPDIEWPATDADTLSSLGPLGDAGSGCQSRRRASP
ncbi:hypothetical protein [Candidatus Accumulibacter sp. ACC007]|nr:hypothetical protein [Candidatus Accumulibacter sp. ACC007]